MGLGEGSAESVTWLKHKEGRIHYRDKEGNDCNCGSVSGNLTEITFRDSRLPDGDVIRNVNLRIIDGEDVFILGVSLGAIYGKTILNKLATAENYSGIFEFSFKYDAGPPKVTTSFVRHNGKSLLQKWTRASPGDMPPPAEVQRVTANGVQAVMRNGRPELDWSEVDKFIERYTLENICPRLNKAKLASPGYSDGSEEHFEDESQESEASPEPADAGSGGIPF